MLMKVTVPGRCPEESRLKQIALLALILSTSATASAALNIDKALSCDMPASDFFRPLVQRKLISAEANSIEDSISYFRPHMPFGSGGMLAFGMKVESVIGYARGQIMFLRGPGTEPVDTYGVIVKEEIANVQAQLRSMGATRVQTRRISKSQTAITCEGV
jgi:hypothetical protein